MHGTELAGSLFSRVHSQIPGTKEMLTVPGVAVVTLAGFLAEVGV
ncbi:hypothetical protein [Paenibacillus polymyxa]|nr:hypothetical protein [Paenibacillus polymyxa]